MNFGGEGEEGEKRLASPLAKMIRRASFRLLWKKILLGRPNLMKIGIWYMIVELMDKVDWSDISDSVSKRAVPHQGAD